MCFEFLALRTVNRCGYTHHGKRLSRSKFLAVNFYSDKLYQGELWLHVNLFTTVDFHFHAIIFPGNTSRTFRASGVFGFKKMLISRTKKHDVNGAG